MANTQKVPPEVIKQMESPHLVVTTTVYIYMDIHVHVRLCVYLYIFMCLYVHVYLDFEKIGAAYGTYVCI
jgi:hypothetical protein